MTVALLDYDGFICKSYYACIARDTDDFDEMLDVLNDLESAAINKIDDLTEVKRVISGHSWKKDIYPSYKLGRKRDENLGAYREYVKFRLEDKLTCVPQLEADEVLVMMYHHFDGEAIVFSDDKDLRYYCPVYCKINITEEISVEDEFLYEQIEQLLAGDSEDGIIGIPKVGMITARKLLNIKGKHNIETVIQVYKEKGIGLDECIKNLVLTIPMYELYVDNYKYDLSDSGTMNNILGQCRFISNKVKEIYELKES